MVLVSLPKHFVKQIYHENLLLTIKFDNLFLYGNLTTKKLNSRIVKKQTKNHPIDHPQECCDKDYVLKKYLDTLQKFAVFYGFS